VEQPSIIEAPVVRDIPRGEFRQVMDGETPARHYLLYVPETIDPMKPIPLVLMFHGGGGTPEGLAAEIRFNREAADKGYMVAYPSGTGSNAGRLFWNVLMSETYATINQVDDLGFVGRLIDDIASRFPVDAKRIYASGFSQGGMLCYRLACDEVLSARIAAIAPVGAVMTVPHADCRAARAVPVMAFAGVRDPIILYNGGTSDKIPRNDRINRPSVKSGIDFWVGRAGLPATPMASGERGAAVMEQYGPDEAGHEVILWSLQDGGHTWPGANSVLPEWLVGSVNRDVNASQLICDFFARHQLP